MTKKACEYKVTDFSCLHDLGGFNRPPAKVGKCSQAPEVNSLYNGAYFFDRSRFLCETSYFKYLKKFHREFKKRLSRRIRRILCSK